MMTTSSGASSKKRQHEWKMANGSRKPKRTKQNANASTAGGVLRLLCPDTYIGCVIGKGGSVISQIRHNTGTRIKVEDSVSGCFERVIFFVGPDQEPGAGNSDVVDDDDNGNAMDEEEETTTTDSGEDGRCEISKPLSVQNALLRIFDRMIEGEKEVRNIHEEGGDKLSATSVRVVVFSSQVDCLKGDDEGLVEEISSDTGAQVEFLPYDDKRPSCISASDELVQISGGIDAIKKALLSVSQQLLENPPLSNEIPLQKIPGPSSASVSWTPKAETQAPSKSLFPSTGPYFADRLRDTAGYQSIRMANNNIIKITFRLLCPEKKAGGVIGRAGSVVKGLQVDTGCEIDVEDGLLNGTERIIVISGPAHPDDRVSPAQDGVLRVQTRIVKCPPESKEPTVTARLLVPSRQIIPLLGRGGIILAEIRKLSRAHVHILGKEQLPQHMSDTDDIIQINGDAEAVQEALLHITAQLQHQFFHEDALHPYMERMEAPQGGPSPHGGFYSKGAPSPFMCNIQRLGVPPHILGRNLPPARFGPQGLMDNGGHLGLLEFVGPPQRRLSGGFNPAIITSTTVEVVVPTSVIPSIYGIDGGCLQQIRQISDASVIIGDPKAGAMETMITISGTPEQTNAAQSLIQAFVILQTESAK